MLSRIAAAHAAKPLIINMITTLELFDLHNKVLKETLIDNELPEAYFFTDPNDPIFNEPLNKI